MAVNRSATGFARRGYTLIELLVVIAVLGLAGAMVIPRMIGRGHLATQAAVQQLIADLSFAQSDGLAQQQMRRVYFYPDGRGYCLIRVDDTSFGDPFDEAPYILEAPNPLAVLPQADGPVGFDGRNPLVHLEEERLLRADGEEVEGAQPRAPGSRRCLRGLRSRRRRRRH